MGRDYAQLWRDYFELTGVLMQFEQITGRRDPELYEALARLRDSALVGEAASPSIGTAA